MALIPSTLFSSAPSRPTLSTASASRQVRLPFLRLNTPARSCSHLFPTVARVHRHSHHPLHLRPRRLLPLLPTRVEGRHALPRSRRRRCAPGAE